MLGAAPRYGYGRSDHFYHCIPRTSFLFRSRASHGPPFTVLLSGELTDRLLRPSWAASSAKAPLRPSAVGLLTSLRAPARQGSSWTDHMVRSWQVALHLDDTVRGLGHASVSACTCPCTSHHALIDMKLACRGAAICMCDAQGSSVLSADILPRRHPSCCRSTQPQPQPLLSLARLRARRRRCRRCWRLY